jgi:hypothetical protein
MFRDQIKKGVAVRETNVFYLSVYNIFRPRTGRWFLRKNTVSDGRHIKYSANIA